MGGGEGGMYERSEAGYINMCMYAQRQNMHMHYVHQIINLCMHKVLFYKCQSMCSGLHMKEANVHEQARSGG